MRKNIYKKQYGFSLIETLIAVSILMVAIAGPLSLVQAGLFSSNHQRNQVIATYLAQEAIEYIKSWRDTNSYTQYTASPANWLAGPDGLLTNTCGGSGCYVDPHGKLPISGNPFVQAVASAGSNLPLKQTTTNGVSIYSYDGTGTFTPYIRTITITPITPINTDEATVSVTVTWNDNGLPRSYTVSENIYNYTYEQTP
jgi:Tfp pilus assembly protein PilV